MARNENYRGRRQSDNQGYDRSWGDPHRNRQQSGYGHESYGQSGQRHNRGNWDQDDSRSHQAGSGSWSQMSDHQDYDDRNAGWGRSSGQYGQYGQESGGQWQGGQSGYGGDRGYGQHRGQGMQSGYGGQRGQGGYGSENMQGGYGGYRSGGHAGGGSSYSSGYGSDYDRRDRGYGADHDDRDWWDRTSDEVASWFGDDEARRRREMDQRREEREGYQRRDSSYGASSYGGNYEGHRGRGPKNYRRSDDRIREDISDRLSDDWRVDASDIEVQVSNCDVILTGTVDSREAKRCAEELAERVSGVANVENRLRVARQDGGSYSSNGGGGTYGSSGGYGSSDTNSGVAAGIAGASGSSGISTGSTSAGTGNTGTGSMTGNTTGSGAQTSSKSGR